MNRTAVFILILLGLGIFLWMQRDEIVTSTSAGTSEKSSPVESNETYIIREKVKPGGYIGWHQSERDRMTHNARTTRQASNYYLVCTERYSGRQKVFLVPASTFNMERIGNTLTSHQLRAFQEVTEIEEPDLPQSFEFRHRRAK